MGGQVLDRADEFAAEIVFREQGGERIVDVAALDVDGDALHMAGGPLAAVWGEGQGRVLGGAGERGTHQGEKQQEIFHGKK